MPSRNQNRKYYPDHFRRIRWQELFNGADSALMKQQEHLKDPGIKEKFWRNETAERRKALLPFFWTTIAREGQLSRCQFRVDVIKAQKF